MAFKCAHLFAENDLSGFGALNPSPRKVATAK